MENESSSKNKEVIKASNTLYELEGSPLREAYQCWLSKTIEDFDNYIRNSLDTRDGYVT